MRRLCCKRTALIETVLAKLSEPLLTAASNRTIVYAPESAGRYFLYAIDDEDGKRNVRTIVDRWLNDLEESEYIPFA